MRRGLIGAVIGAALAVGVQAFAAWTVTPANAGDNGGAWRSPMGDECPDVTHPDGMTMRAAMARPGCGLGRPCCAYLVDEDCGASCDGGVW